MNDISSLFFYHRVYLNGVQILLEKESLERFCQTFEDIKTFFKLENIRTIFDIPLDAELLNQNEIPKDPLSPLIFNFYSKNSNIREKTNRDFSSSINFSGLKLLNECEKYKLFAYPQKMEEELDEFFSVIILGTEEQNEYFINGFLNFLFGINEEDNYRFALEVLENNNNERKKQNHEKFIEKKVISSEKGNFVFTCINVDISTRENNFMEFIEYIKIRKFNLIIFNIIYHEKGINYEFDISDKNNCFFTCPNIFYDQLKLTILEKEFKSLKKPEEKDNNDSENDSTKEIFLFLAKFDEFLRQKLVSCNFIFDSIFSKENNQDIFFKYLITMRGYEYFYDILSSRKDTTIDFSLIEKHLSTIYNKYIDIRKKKAIFSEKKGENWTEYHLYEMSIKKLNKQTNEKESEIDELNQQKEKKNKLFNDKIENCQNEIENMKFYNTMVQKNPSLLLPVTSDKIGNKIYEGNEHNVCKICKHTCHINCDEFIKTFCQCYKFQLNGFKCKVCPNKCFSGSHEVVSYKYPKYNYKNINDILRPYLTLAQKNMSLRNKINYVIGLKEEEKRNIIQEKEKSLKNIDDMIEERNKCIKEYSELISDKTDKKDKIYEENKKIINEEIEKYNSLILPKNMKLYEMLFVQTFSLSFKEEKIGYYHSSSMSIGSLGGRCC